MGAFSGNKITKKVLDSELLYTDCDTNGMNSAKRIGEAVTVVK